MRNEPHELQAKPLLLVDIDGVISLFGPSSDERPEGTWLLVEGIPHVLSQAAAAHLHALTGSFEPVWCSGWEEKANEYLPGALALGPFPFLRFDATRSQVTMHAHWKLAAIEAYAAQRPLAWVDDAFTPACHAWAAARAAPTLLVATDPARGLTATEADTLQSWAAGRAGGPHDGGPPGTAAI